MGNESRDRFERGVGLVALWRMTAVVEREDFERAGALALDSLDLFHGPVLIFPALNDENRAGDLRQIFFDIPAAEIGMKPDVVPPPEGASGIAVVASEFFRKIRGFKFRLSLGDAGHAQLFDEDMRCEKNETADVIVHSSVNEGDGAAVAVPDEDGIFDFELRQKFGQGFERFVVHVADGARFGQNVGIPVAIARVDRYGASGGLGDACGKILPVRERAQAFVEKNEFRSAWLAGGNAENFQAMIVYVQERNLRFIH